MVLNEIYVRTRDPFKDLAYNCHVIYMLGSSTLKRMSRLHSISILHKLQCRIAYLHSLSVIVTIIAPLKLELCINDSVVKLFV